jgi:hypothetical protein
MTLTAAHLLDLQMSTESNDMCNTIVAWAQAIPTIRRGWLVGDASRCRRGDEIKVAIEVEPVGDSEETLVLWLANSDQWQSQLQEQTRLPVSLEWFDLDGRTPKVRGALAKVGGLIYERAD